MTSVIYYKFAFPLLPYSVDILIGNAMLDKYAIKYHVQGFTSIRAILDGRSRGCVMMGSTLADFVVMLPEEYDPITVGHECIHLANQLWEKCGAQLTTDNDEVITYTCDYIHKYIKEVCYVNQK